MANLWGKRTAVITTRPNWVRTDTAGGPFTQRTLPHARRHVKSPSSRTRWNGAGASPAGPGTVGGDAASERSDGGDAATRSPGSAAVSGDVLAVLLGTAGALALTWAGVEIRGYLAWARRGRGGRAPDRWRLRAAVYAGLAVVGALLGLALGTWLRG